MDGTFKELDEHFKTYSDHTVAQGQIRVRPGTRKNIKAFVQWTRDQLLLGRDPTTSPFPVELVGDLIRRYKTHEKFLTDSKTLSEAAKPDIQGIHKMGGRLEANISQLFTFHSWARWYTIEVRLQGER